MSTFGIVATVIVVGGIVTLVPFILGFTLLNTGLREISNRNRNY